MLRKIRPEGSASSTNSSRPGLRSKRLTERCIGWGTRRLELASTPFGFELRRYTVLVTSNLQHMSPHFVFYGTFMRGQPGHANLEDATFLEEVRTAPCYRLYYVDGRWPALVRAENGAEIACELYELSEQHLERLAEIEPPEWRRAAIELADGRTLEAFLGDPGLRSRGVDISSHGGWPAFTRR